MNLYKRVQEAAAKLPDTQGLRLVAGPQFRMPPSDHMLPPFISMASLRWDIPKGHRDAMVAAELNAYNADMQRRMSQDPFAVFGLQFGRDTRGDSQAIVLGADLAVMNGTGDVHLVDLS